MKKIIFAFLIISFITSIASAEELYTWTDKNGVENITTTPPPEKVKVKHQTKYKRPSAQESEAFQRKATAAINKSFKGWQNSTAQKSSSPAPAATKNTTPTYTRTYVDPDPGWYDRKMMEMNQQRLESQIQKQQSDINRMEMNSYINSIGR